MLSPTQMIVLACGGGTAAGAVVYALTAATDPEQRLARAREEMMRIPRAPGERGRAGRGEGPDAPRATDGRGVETASTTERLETVARATEAFYRGDDDRPK